VAILLAKPSPREATFVIEPKRIVLVDQVRREIDLFVEIDLGDGCKAISIFECKNWAKNVDKNVVIVFSEKTKALQAQKGYIVPKGFSKHAIAQAKRIHA